MDSSGGWCYYTLVELETEIKSGGCTKPDGNRARYVQPHLWSLSKLIPDEGYTRGNTVFATSRINLMKGVMTEDEFMEVCGSVIGAAGPRRMGLMSRLREIPWD